MGEDRERVPGTRFLTPFDVGKEPNHALLPLPQVCDRHRRRLKQGARCRSVCVRALCSTGIVAARAVGQAACVGVVISFSLSGMVLPGPDIAG
jgi:hypothetical protein